MAYLLPDSKLFKSRTFILFIPCPEESDLQGAVDTTLLNEISFTSYRKYLKRSALQLCTFIPWGIILYHPEIVNCISDESF